VTTSDLDRVRSDFDRIALLPERGGVDHNARYHDYLLRHVPRNGQLALDIGCGRGAFARRLARRCERLIAIDLSPNMIRVAREQSREQSRDCPNIEFDVADVMSYDLGAERFDCIASIAALHHLPQPELLPRLARALRPGGVLVVLDLCRSAGVRERALDVAAMATSALSRVARGRWRLDPDMSRAWREHGATDRYLTLPEMRAMCRAHLPGAIVTRHLMWRYSIVWTRPLAVVQRHRTALVTASTMST
jgi:2-polyprenyl-3-methyl-5-hydroxy-6-metoxy-1,4-benzoquinol methylase